MRGGSEKRGLREGKTKKKKTLLLGGARSLSNGQIEIQCRLPEQTKREQRGI